MAGSSRTMAKEQRSLFGEILDWMLAPLLLLWPMSLGLTGLVAQEIANRPYDRELSASARLIASQLTVEPGEPANVLPRLRVESRGALEFLRADDEDQVFFLVLGARGEWVAGDRDLPVPEDPPEGPGTLRFRDDLMRDEPVRVVSLIVELPGVGGHTALVQYAETLQKRNRLSAEIIKGVILPQFAILPVAVLLVWLALSKGFAPLNELQQRIRARDSQDLSPIDGRNVPEEVAPLVASVNDLLRRLEQSVATQKHFLADAAHQLKTPLAGLRMQAEIAAREIDAGQSDPQSLKGSLHQIALSSQRAAHSVNQLLALARAEDREQALRFERCDLVTIVQQAVLDLYPKAQDRHIDLGYEGADPGPSAAMPGQPVLLGELVRNLLDNALQYTPPQGTVTARVLPDPFGQVLVLQIEDTGPGIPEAERELVFRPFYRALGTGVEGTGLGLAIVREIAQVHSAEIVIADARQRPATSEAGPGALFTLRFPLRRAVSSA